MKRREFMVGLGGAAAAWPVVARTQQAMPVIGLINSGTPAANAANMAGLHQGLKEVGYVEGQNLKIEYRWAEGRYETLPTLMADLVRRHVAVIIANGNVAASVAKAATATTPIVFTTGDDPISTGLVSSLNRPGSNLTGATTFAGALPTKRLELLHEVVPSAITVAMLINPSNANAETDATDVQTAASAVGIKVIVAKAATESEFDTQLAAVVKNGARALVVNSDALFTLHRDQLAAMVARHKLPAIYANRELADAGGLMTYGATDGFPGAYRQAGAYTGRIVRGEKAGELPVAQPTKFALIINLKAAKAINLAIPESFLLRADEVIE
jgi:putative ABC transport system substrate-binding protein